jgi:hypothetical protein
VADDPERRSPPAFLTSAGFGGLGLLLLVLGLATAEEGLYLAGVAAGVVSLVAALVWREELIVAWNARKKQQGN